MVDRERSIKYNDVLTMVSDPRRNIDADENFVGYDVLLDQLTSYRDNYVITEEEYQFLKQRLEREKAADPNGDDA